jgi:hypothetical protein
MRTGNPPPAHYVVLLGAGTAVDTAVPFLRRADVDVERVR